jgi:hypothetical protein
MLQYNASRNDLIAKQLEFIRVVLAIGMIDDFACTQATHARVRTPLICIGNSRTQQHPAAIDCKRCGASLEQARRRTTDAARATRHLPSAVQRLCRYEHQPSV